MNGIVHVIGHIKMWKKFWYDLNHKNLAFYLYISTVFILVLSLICSSLIKSKHKSL